MAGTTVQETGSELSAERAERLDGYVARARLAADHFRVIDDQAQVDRIVHALVVAGLEHAVELARLAMEDTGFGVFEDKVVKNYIATEFLHVPEGQALRGRDRAGRRPCGLLRRRADR